MKTEYIALNAARKVSLSALLHETANTVTNERRPAVIILPGGRYRQTSDNEADPAALAYAQAGYQAFVLRYSVGEHAAWPNPLDDYEQAMAMIRKRAEEWDVAEDKIAVVGFSSGGHLAAAAATMGKNRPNAAILGYAVLGKEIKLRLESAPIVKDMVDKDTPPCFLFATRTDQSVPIRSTIDFSAALADAGIPFESHIYVYGPHGFSTCAPDVQDMHPEVMCGRTKNWVSDSLTWLSELF